MTEVNIIALDWGKRVFEVHEATACRGVAFRNNLSQA